MGKSEIIRQLADRIFGNCSETEIKACTDFCDTLADIITDALIEEKRIVWKGFFTAEVIERAERKGRNPKTNEIVTFPPVKMINCKFSRTIKDMVNGK